MTDFSDDFKAGVKYAQAMARANDPSDAGSLAEIYLNFSPLQKSRFMKKIKKAEAKIYRSPY